MFNESASNAYAQISQVVISKPSGFNITNLGSLVSGAIGITLLLAGVLLFAYLAWGGIQWITAGGDKAQVEAARGRITNALTGLVIVAAAWALIGLIEYFLGVKFTETLDLPRLY